MCRRNIAFRIRRQRHCDRSKRSKPNVDRRTRSDRDTPKCRRANRPESRNVTPKSNGADRPSDGSECDRHRRSGRSTRHFRDGKTLSDREKRRQTRSDRVRSLREISPRRSTEESDCSNISSRFVLQNRRIILPPHQWRTQKVFSTGQFSSKSNFSYGEQT